MNNHRVQHIAFNQFKAWEGNVSRTGADILKSLGCLSEMIQWKLRLFVPANDNAHLIIEQLLQVA